MIRYRDSHCPRVADQAYLVYQSVLSNKEVINRYEDYEDAKLCQAHLIRAREVKKRQRISESMKFLLAQELHTTRNVTPKKSQRCNDSNQWWHKLWIWVCIHVTEAAANINAMSFCNVFLLFVLDSKGVRISVSKLTLQERSQFMKEEASQLYTTVVSRHSAYLTACLTAWIFRTWWCRYMSMLSPYINVISLQAHAKLEASLHSKDWANWAKGNGWPAGRDVTSLDHRAENASAAAQQRYVGTDRNWYPKYYVYDLYMLMLI